MSGETAAPWGEGRTVRAMGWLMSHSSTLMMNQTATFAPSGRVSLGRSKMEENSARGLGMGRASGDSATVGATVVVAL